MQWHGRNVDSLCSLQEWTSDQDYVMFKLERPHIKLSTLTSLKDQLGYNARDFLYYKKRCGRDVASLQPLDFGSDKFKVGASKIYFVKQN